VLAVSLTGCQRSSGDDKLRRELEALARQLEAVDVVQNPPLAADVASKTTYPSAVDPYFKSRTDPQVRLTYGSGGSDQVGAIKADLAGRGWSQFEQHDPSTSFAKREAGLCLIGVVSASTAQTPVALVVTVDRSGSRCAALTN
jgi:hypothetical protein